MHGCTHIYNKLDIVLEQCVHSITYGSGTVFKIFQNSKWSSPHYIQFWNRVPMFMQFTGCHQPVKRFYWPKNAIDWLREC